MANTVLLRHCISLLLVSILFFSCKKEKNSLHSETISGLVLHTITKQPLANQSIYIWTTTREAGSASGEPIFNSSEYYTTTDNNGKFEITVQVGNDWLFGVSLVTREYVQKNPSKNAGVIWGSNTQNNIAMARILYDTISGERPGFILYDLKNINDTYQNDSLFINVYSYKSFGQPTGPVVLLNAYSGYNWIFPGQNIDMQIRDTIPAESMQQIPINWFHKRTDTIIKRSDFINISVGNTSNYQIFY